MKQVEINAELRITYELPDDSLVFYGDELETGLTMILQDELSDGSDNLKVRVIVRGVDVIKENE